MSARLSAIMAGPSPAFAVVPPGPGGSRHLRYARGKLAEGS